MTPVAARTSFEDHNQPGADQKPGLKSGLKEWNQLFGVKAVYKDVDDNTYKYRQFYRELENEDDQDGERNTPGALRQQLQ